MSARDMRPACMRAAPVLARRRRLVAAGLVLALSFGLAGLPPADAQAAPATPSDADARAVRQVVEAQLRAMADGDAERAFSYAAPAIRAQFVDAARFMAMVTGTYPMVVRPASTVFFQPTLNDGQVLQVVQLRDRAGRHWRAAYLLARQSNGAWRIAGCVVSAQAGDAST